MVIHRFFSMCNLACGLTTYIRADPLGWPTFKSHSACSTRESVLYAVNTLGETAFRGGTQTSTTFATASRLFSLFVGN